MRTVRLQTAELFLELRESRQLASCDDIEALHDDPAGYPEAYQKSFPLPPSSFANQCAPTPKEESLLRLEHSPFLA